MNLSVSDCRGEVVDAGGEPSSECLPDEVVVEGEGSDPEADVPRLALLLPAGEVVVEAFDPVLEGLVEPLHEVLPPDGVYVVLHPEPPARFRVPRALVRPDGLPPIHIWNGCA